MAELTRKNAREEAFRLLFETEFRNDAEAEAIYASAGEHRGLPENAYVRRVYFGVREHMEEIDEKITKHSDGWKAARITPISRSAMRLCIYEMLFMEDIPTVVSINEAIDLVKKYDDPKMKAFVNGVLNGVKTEIEAEKI